MWYQKAFETVITAMWREVKKQVMMRKFIECRIKEFAKEQGHQNLGCGDVSIALYFVC